MNQLHWKLLKQEQLKLAMTETLGKDTETMTDLSMSDIQYLDALEKDCYHCRVKKECQC